MVSTTAAAIPKQASFSMLKELKPNLVTKVLEFLDLPQTLQVSATCTILRRRVNKDCSSLWRHLDFSTLSPTARSNLTDKSLAGLLKRVNAKHVTQSIILAGCSNVDGSGLSPCRRSPVLEYIDLRRDNPGERNEERKAVRELRTMIHYKLARVRFNEPLASYSCGVTNFLRDLHAAKLKQALEKKIPCHGCGDAVADESMQLVPNVTGVPPQQCNECKHFFCLFCPVQMEICVCCGGAKCTQCSVKDGTGTICGACARSYCKTCADSLFTGECGICKEVSCKSCRFFCSTCDKIFCSFCTETQGCIFFCFSCNKKYCFSCREVIMCQDCETFLCEECLEVKRCGYCSGFYCIRCRDVTSIPNGTGGTVDVCTKCQDKMEELL